MTNHIENIFMCFSAFYIFYLVKRLFKSFVCSFRCLVYLLLSCEVALDVVDMPVSVRVPSGESLTGDWSNGELTHKSQTILTDTEKQRQGQPLLAELR